MVFLNINDKDHYDKFFEVCVDNVDSPTEMEFYVNADDQASSLCQWNYDNLSSDKSDDSKFYYSESTAIKYMAHRIKLR